MKSQLLLKLVTSSIVICCQRLCVVQVSYRKLSYYIWKLRYYRAVPLEPGEHKFTGPLALNYNKKVSFSWLETYFMKGMPQKSVHLRTSRPPDWKPTSWRECHRKVCIFERLRPPTMVWAVLRKLVNLIYIWVFFSSLWPPSSFKWFGGPPLGVYNSFPLTTKYVKEVS